MAACVEVNHAVLTGRRGCGWMVPPGFTRGYFIGSLRERCGGLEGVLCDRILSVRHGGNAEMMGHPA